MKAKKKIDMLGKRKIRLSFYGYNTTDKKSYTLDTWKWPVTIVTWLTAHFKIH